MARYTQEELFGLIVELTNNYRTIIRRAMGLKLKT